MPKGSDHLGIGKVKGIYLGDSGTGKTTSLCSLLALGLKLKIYDFDNLLDSLIARVKRDCPDKLDNLEYMPFRDQLKTTANGPICAQPKAFVSFLRALDQWEDGSVPSEWGTDTVVVIDSWTLVGRAAYFWARGLQGASSFAEGVPLKGFDARQAFYTGQQALMNVISLLTADDFHPSILVIAHVKYLERDGVTKGYPNSLGSAIAPEIPSYFSSALLASRQGDKRIIQTASTNMVDLKNPKSFEILPQLPMESGLATFFSTITH